MTGPVFNCIFCSKEHSIEESFMEISSCISTKRAVEEGVKRKKTPSMYICQDCSLDFTMELLKYKTFDF